MQTYIFQLVALTRADMAKPRRVLCYRNKNFHQLLYFLLYDSSGYTCREVLKLILKQSKLKDIVDLYSRYIFYAY